jgi:DNA-binding MarR family transcriptional regulator
VREVRGDLNAAAGASGPDSIDLRAGDLDRGAGVPRVGRDLLQGWEALDPVRVAGNEDLGEHKELDPSAAGLLDEPDRLEKFIRARMIRAPKTGNVFFIDDPGRLQAVNDMAGARAAKDSARRSVQLAVPPDLVAAPGYGVRRLYQAYLAAWSRYVDAVLTGPQFAVLCAVLTYPDADQTSLASAVALDTSTMADVCRRMERRGLIARAPSSRDARRKLISLTEAGKAAHLEVNRRARALDQALLEGCSPDQRAGIALLLNSLGQQWEGVAKVTDSAIAFRDADGAQDQLGRCGSDGSIRTN